jgi:hypothetical protein
MNKVKIEGTVKFEPKVYGAGKTPMALLTISYQNGEYGGMVDVKVFHQDVHKIALNDRIGLLGTVQKKKQTGGKFKDAWINEVVCNDLKIYEKSGEKTPLQQEALLNGGKTLTVRGGPDGPYRVEKEETLTDLDVPF